MIDRYTYVGYANELYTHFVNSVEIIVLLYNMKRKAWLLSHWLKRTKTIQFYIAHTGRSSKNPRESNWRTLGIIIYEAMETIQNHGLV